MSKDINKNELKKLLQISNSYLHDSANLFALAHSNLKELSLKINNSEDENLNKESLEELMNLLNFLKGSEYHFKDIFHDLENLCESSLSKENAYPLSIIDLKDLLEMELLEIFTHRRIKFVDNIIQNNALSLANFPLITKCLFNLIENALKHGLGEVKISLDDAKDYWKLSIISAEANLSIDLEKSLKQAASSAQGHGLKSVLEILKYNNIEIEFLSLGAAGSLINLYFNKLKDTDKAIQGKLSKNKLIKNFFNFKILIVLVIISISFWGINLIRTQLELNYQINQISRISLSKDSQKKFFKLKNIIEKDIHYHKKIEATREIIDSENLQIPLEKLITALILKRDLVNFNELNLSKADLNTLKSFSNKLYTLYELDYFLARNFRHRGEILLEYYYEAKAVYKQLYCFFFPSLERKALEENNLDFGLEMALRKNATRET